MIRIDLCQTSFGKTNLRIKQLCLYSFQPDLVVKTCDLRIPINDLLDKQVGANTSDDRILVKTTYSYVAHNNNSYNNSKNWI